MTIAERTSTKRRRETFEAVTRIHGGSPTNVMTAISGLVDTLTTKFAEKNLVNAISKKKKLCEHVFPKIYNRRVKEFEMSEHNLLRSIATYFNRGVMGKRKYRAVYRSMSMNNSKSTVGDGKGRIKMSCNVARLVSYDKMMAHVRSLEIGKVCCVKKDFCYGLDDCEKVEGCYWHLVEFLPLLAHFYFKLVEVSGEDLLWFGNEVNRFHVVLGGDGAPFGKDNTACSWLISFLNRGKNILSSSENFMIFGANCEENSVVIQRYVKFLLHEITEIEKRVFNINGANVTFRFSEFPNDLKMIAFLAGELPVSATYFSTFGNVNINNCDEPKGQFGTGSSCTWRPWSYSERVNVSKKVRELKEKVEKQKCSNKTKRSKISKFIAGEQSRQEFEPLIGPFVDRAHIDPLHVKNNACQQIFRLILYQSIAKSALASSITHFNDVPNSTSFYKLINCLFKTAKLARLANKIKRWFNDSNGSGKDFQYRFTGQDSRMFLHNFMFIIDSLREPSDTEKDEFSLHTFAYISLQLRDSVSVFCRVVNVTVEELDLLKLYCLNFFRACCLFTRSISPTIWNVGHLIPAHALQVFEKYQLGLNVVSMEGRESKHVAIARYSRNTNFSGRWWQIFRYEFVQMIWLRERGYYSIDNIDYKQTYIPSKVTTGDSCWCGFQKDSQGKCHYCSHKYRKVIEDSVHAGTLLMDKKLIDKSKLK